MFNDENSDGSERHDLGSCHACDRTNANGANVRNILMLNLKCPVPGTGWGCIVCNLPSNGASSVLCDDCLAAGNKPKYAFAGYPLEKERIEINKLTDPFIHDEEMHRLKEGVFCISSEIGEFN